jgi:membrane-bound lytic murein transglycosylase B
LSSGLQPLEPPIRLNTVTPESPHDLLSFYEAAQRRYGVDWAILAAINFVETRFGRILGPSSAGAIGPMQFLPSTWEQYGKGGDIRDPRDAIFGAARYLRASNVLTNPRGAVFAYNRSDAYVEAVLTYARQMQRRPETFYEYYFWQVFVRTTKGDVQLTGPGAKIP